MCILSRQRSLKSPQDRLKALEASFLFESSLGRSGRLSDAEHIQRLTTLMTLFINFARL